MTLDAQVATLAAWLAIFTVALCVGFVAYHVARAASPLIVGILIALGVVE